MVLCVLVIKVCFRYLMCCVMFRIMKMKKWVLLFMVVVVIGVLLVFYGLMLFGFYCL